TVYHEVTVDHVSRRDTQDPMRHRGPKERWLHTRISETLEDALKREARRRRQPVSLLVRNVLEGALDLVEDIVAFGSSATRKAADDAAVYGWQEIVLNRPAECAQCRATLDAGLQAWRGLRDRPGPPTFQCDACVRRLRRPTEQPEEEAT